MNHKVKLKEAVDPSLMTRTVAARPVFLLYILGSFLLFNEAAAAVPRFNEFCCCFLFVDDNSGLDREKKKEKMALAKAKALIRTRKKTQKLNRQKRAPKAK